MLQRSSLITHTHTQSPFTHYIHSTVCPYSIYIYIYSMYIYSIYIAYSIYIYIAYIYLHIIHASKMKGETLSCIERLISPHFGDLQNRPCLNDSRWGRGRWLRCRKRAGKMCEKLMARFPTKRMFGYDVSKWMMLGMIPQIIPENVLNWCWKMMFLSIWEDFHVLVLNICWH